MVSVEQRKRDILWNVQQNPLSITVTRTERTLVDGAHDTRTFDLPQQIVRLARTPYKATPKVSNEAATEHRDTYVMLVPAGGDVRADHEVQDSFTHTELGTFKVIEIQPIIVQGMICGYHALVTRVK